MKLTKAQKQWIRTQYNKWQGLNITRVYREKPEIIRAAFSGDEPQGWRRTLLSLDIDPYSIEHDLEDTVECHICGEHLSALNSHLMRKHGCTPKEYREEFGRLAPLVSEVILSDRFWDSPFPDIPHWERFWNKYYVFDFVIAIGESGYALNCGNMPQQITQFGKRYFGSWDALVLRSGYSDHRLVAEKTTMTAEEVLEEIHRRAELKRQGQFILMPSGLNHQMRRHFGTLKAAYDAAGLTPKEVKSHGTRYSDKDIEVMVKEAQKLPPLRGKIRIQATSAFRKKYKNLLKLRFGTNLAHFVARAGIPLETFSTTLYRNAEDVHHDLDVIEASGRALTRKNVTAHSVCLIQAVNRNGWGSERVTKSTKIPDYDPKSKCLTDRLKRWRVENKISKIKAAERLGITDYYYAIMEAGDHSHVNTKIAKTIREEFKKAGIPVTFTKRK